MAGHKSNVPRRSGARLTWAVGAHGDATRILEAENGLKCACICPACDGPLVARNGFATRGHGTANGLAYCPYDICAGKKRGAGEAPSHNGLIAA